MRAVRQPFHAIVSIDDWQPSTQVAAGTAGGARQRLVGEEWSAAWSDRARVRLRRSEPFLTDLPTSHRRQSRRMATAIRRGGETVEVERRTNVARQIPQPSQSRVDKFDAAVSEGIFEPRIGEAVVLIAAAAKERGPISPIVATVAGGSSHSRRLDVTFKSAWGTANWRQQCATISRRANVANAPRAVIRSRPEKRHQEGVLAFAFDRLGTPSETGLWETLKSVSST
jgi:hypothetical protein